MSIWPPVPLHLTTAFTPSIVCLAPCAYSLNNIHTPQCLSHLTITFTPSNVRLASCVSPSLHCVITDTFTPRNVCFFTVGVTVITHHRHIHPRAVTVSFSSLRHHLITFTPFNVCPHQIMTHSFTLFTTVHSLSPSFTPSQSHATKYPKLESCVPTTPRRQRFLPITRTPCTVRIVCTLNASSPHSTRFHAH